MQKQLPNHTPAVNWEERVEELERLYEKKYPNEALLDITGTLFERILGWMGNEHAQELRTYTDLLIALYNKDTDWFYLKGLRDGKDGHIRM
ncbi:MAG: hypothetical protein ABF449_10280 [Ethanoligenens sp.]